MIPTSICSPSSRHHDLSAPVRRAVALVAALAFAAPTIAAAQLARGDTLLKQGRLAAAESLYYDAITRNPRDPAARLTLGWLLGARGKLRTAAVLMEEARFFGADPQAVAEQVAPIYARLGEYGALADLPASRLSPAERMRAAWLHANAPRVSGPDSGTVSWMPADDDRTLGSVVLRIGTDSVIAILDATVTSLVLDTSWARRIDVRRFVSRGDGDSKGLAAVVAAVQIGPMTISNVPAAFAPQGRRSRATIGLDVFSRFAPTFDMAAAHITLRRSGEADAAMPGERLATLTYGSGTWLVTAGTTVPIGSADGARLLANRRWTLHPSRGEIIAFP